MKTLIGPCCLVLLLLPCSFGQTSASPVKRVPARATASVNGKDLYRQYCGSCHGVDGKGNGPAAPALKMAPTDLTRMALKNGGKFPEERTLHILQGEESIVAHGSADMPVWGGIFNNLSPNLSLTQTRTHDLLNYLEGIQAK